MKFGVLDNVERQQKQAYEAAHELEDERLSQEGLKTKS